VCPSVWWFRGLFLKEKAWRDPLELDREKGCRGAKWRTRVGA